MTSTAERARAFVNLHVPGQPVVLYNVWDAGSARVVAQAGAKALATGSWSVAMAHGYADGEEIPLDLVIANLEGIVRVASTMGSLPVTLDFETGYGSTAAEVGDSFTRVLEAGAVGANLEDRVIDDDALRPIAEQCERLAAAREAANRLRIPAFLNARTDVFLQADPDSHDEALVDAALTRAAAYAEAGASGFFAPGLVREPLIARLREGSPLPVNIMASPHAPAGSRLAELGVARISHGPWPYRLAMKTLEQAARAVHGTEI